MAFLRAFASHLPERVVTNDELAPQLAVDPAWIEQVSGIRERRYAAPPDTVASLATAAAQRCLARAGLEATDLGAILLASGSSDRFCPGPAATVSAALGLTSTFALDIPVASAGSLIALGLAMRLAPTLGRVLVLGAEIMSRRVDLTPEGKNTAILFGDGAGACLVDPEVGFARLVDDALFTDGNAAEILHMADQRLVMDGGAVILQASRKIPRAITLLLEKHHIAPADVNQVLIHQANLNLIQRVARATAIDPARFFVNITRYGNTSAASLLIAAAEWAETIPGQAGEPPVPNSPAPPHLDGPIVFAAFGTGLNWGALLGLPA